MKVWTKGDYVIFKNREHGVLVGEVLRKRLQYVKVGALGLGWFTWVHADRLTPANLIKD
jgi:hypothetical protein